MARKDPWADIIDFEGGATQRSQAPASRPTPMPVEGQPQPVEQVDEFGAVLEEIPQGQQGPRVAGGNLAGDIGFYNESAMEANSRPEQSDAYQQAMWAGLQDGSIRTPEQANQLAARFGLHIPDQEALRAAFAPGATITGVNPAEYPTRPVSELRQNALLPEQADAFARGVAGAVGLDDEIDAIVTTAIQGGDFRQNLANSRAIRDYDEENNFWPRFGGEVTGGVLTGAAVPSRIQQAGRVAAREALRAGLGREAALVAARRAVARQSAIEGGTFGGIAGAGEGDTAVDRLTGGLGGAAAGGLAGGVLGDVGARFAQRGMNPAPLTEGQQVLQAAERQGVSVLPADVGGTATRRMTSGTLQTPFGAGAIETARDRSTDSMVVARDRIAEAIAPILDPESLGQTILSGARSQLQADKSAAGAAFRAAEKAADGALVTPIKAIASLDANLAELNQIPGGSPAAAILQAVRDDLAKGDYPVAAIAATRKALRDQFMQSGLIGSDVERRAMQAVDAMQEDVVDSLTAQGKAGAANLYSRANRMWRDLKRNENEVLVPLIGTRERPRAGEQVVKTLMADLQGNNARAVKLLRALPPEEQNSVRASIIGGLGRTGPNADEFSFDVFLTNWGDKKFGKSAKNAFFGQETRAALDDLAKIAEARKQAQQSLNRSNTGGAIEANRLFTYITAIPSLGFSVGSQYALGRLLASPRFARWLARAPKTQLSAPAYIDRLSRIARAEPAIAGDILQLQRRLQEAMASPARLAAEEMPNDYNGIVWENNEGAERSRQTEPTP